MSDTAVEPIRLVIDAAATPEIAWRYLTEPDRIAEAGADEALRDDHEAYWSGYLDDLRDLLAEDAARP